MEKYGTVCHATDDIITRHVHFACCIPKATDKHSEYVILITFHGNKGLANEPLCLYVNYLLCYVLYGKWEDERFCTNW
jgi:hypothetical protein